MSKKNNGISEMHYINPRVMWLLFAILMTSLIILTLFVYRLQHPIENVFDEIYYMDNRLLDAQRNYDYIDDLGYECIKFRETGFPGGRGYKDVTWFINETPDGRQYTIENGTYRNGAISLSARSSNDSDLEVKYEYLYYPDAKAYRPYVYVYYLTNDDRNRADVENDVEKLTAEAKDIVDQFIVEYITYNKGKTKYQTDNWGTYKILKGEIYEYE